MIGPSEPSFSVGKVVLFVQDSMWWVDWTLFCSIHCDIVSDTTCSVARLSCDSQKAILNNPVKQTQRLLERPSGYGVTGNEIGNLAQDVSILWRELPVPVIAVLHGMCYGAGLQIALGADMRYASNDCKMSIMEGKWGLIPDMGAAITLRELIRIDVAKELTMTGRIVSGEEAANLGLITKACEDPMQYAKERAAEIVGKSPDAVAATKKLFQRSWFASEKECLEIESELQVKLMASWNQVAASGRSTTGWEVPYLKRKPE
jgi:hypothetical protein